MIVAMGYFFCWGVSQSSFQVAGSVTASTNISVMSLKFQAVWFLSMGSKSEANSGNHYQYYVRTGWEGEAGIHDGKSLKASFFLVVKAWIYWFLGLMLGFTLCQALFYAFCVCYSQRKLIIMVLSTDFGLARLLTRQVSGWFPHWLHFSFLEWRLEWHLCQREVGRIEWVKIRKLFSRVPGR